jgi:hypothetical protein
VGSQWFPWRALIPESFLVVHSATDKSALLSSTSWESSWCVSALVGRAWELTRRNWKWVNTLEVESYAWILRRCLHFIFLWCLFSTHKMYRPPTQRALQPVEQWRLNWTVLQALPARSVTWVHIHLHTGGMEWEGQQPEQTGADGSPPHLHCLSYWYNWELWSGEVIWEVYFPDEQVVGAMQH